MTYQKRCPDYLFTGYELLGPGNVLITDKEERIIDIVPRQEAGDDVQEIRGLLSPGFINAHCHLELSHMMGRVQEHSGMTGFISSLMIQRFTEKEKIYEAIAAAEDEMYRNGIVGVGDICNSTDTFQQKLHGRIRYYNFIEAMGLAHAGQRFSAAKTVYTRMLELPHPASIVPHAPYSVSDELFELISRNSSSHILSCHNQESQEETDYMLSGEGAFRELFLAMNIPEQALTARHKRSLQFMLPFFKDALKVILVHNVFTSEDDMAELDQYDSSRFFWCLCPNANRYITGLLPGISLITRNKDQVVLGTDSYASNHQLCILSEMKTLSFAFPNLELEDMLKWATINGAKALGMQDSLGAFRKGTIPGIVLVEGISEGKIGKDTRCRRLGL